MQISCTGVNYLQGRAGGFQQSAAWDFPLHSSLSSPAGECAVPTATEDLKI